MRWHWLPLLLLALPGSTLSQPVVSPARIVLPATEFTLRLGMSYDAAETALQPMALERRGEEPGRAVYTVGVDVGASDYTVDLAFAADSLISVAVSAIDSGLVDQWFRARADSLPLSTSYERAAQEDEFVRETWTTFEAVWITEHPLIPEPGIDMTYWEFHRR